MPITPPPSEPPVYTKIDDSAFYVTSTASTQFDVVALGHELEGRCMATLQVAVQLRAAADAGVGKAAALVAVLQSVTAFSDDAAAAAFFTALRTARDT